MKKLMVWAAFLGGSFLAAALGFVIYLSANRGFGIADAGIASGATEFSDSEEFSLQKKKSSERYEKVVVLDAEVSDGLNAQEKEALYQIEEKLQTLLEAEGIQVYSASGHREEAGEQNKRMLVEQTKASLYLGLMFEEDEDAERFGSYVCYNGLYYRPWLTNGSFADRMEREMVTEIEGKALGLVEVQEGILSELSIPAVIACPGYVSHETEGALLLTDAYQERVAKGLCRGILGTFEELE